MVDEQRIAELEMKVAFQEDTIQALNDLVYLQQTHIEKIERMCVELHSQLRHLGEDKHDPTEKPPHY